MTVDPIQTGGSRPHREKAPERSDRTHRSDAANPARDGAGHTGSSTVAGDRAELSEAAKLLTEEALAAASGEPRGTLPPGKLALVSKRLLEGSYDTEAVRQAIAEGLLEDLQTLEEGS